LPKKVAGERMSWKMISLIYVLQYEEEKEEEGLSSRRRRDFPPGATSKGWRRARRRKETPPKGGIGSRPLSLWLTVTPWCLQADNTCGPESEGGSERKERMLAALL